jgi:hypothetical protein
MELTSITVSTSRKVNHSLYGGEQYESSDNFVSLTAEVETGANLIESHRELMLTAKELNNTAVAHDILKLQGGYSWTDFFGLLRDYRLGKLQLTDEVTLKMNQTQKSILEEMKKLKRAK